MTTEQLYLFNGLYLILLAVVAVLTRATPRRIMGAVAGGLAVGVAGLGIITLGEKAMWWDQVITWQAYFFGLLGGKRGVVAFFFLVSWRDRRRLRLGCFFLS